MNFKLLVVSILTLVSLRIYGDTTYYHVQPIDTTLFNQNYPAEFAWYVPTNADSIKAIYFFINGVWGSSLDIVSDTDYVDLANRQNVILMGCKMHPLMSREANIWSADATVNAIDSLSLMMGKPFIKNLPMFMEGYSLGGQFAYHFTRIFPDRVIAYTTMKGGVHDTTASNKKTRDVPSLWFMGELDTKKRIDNLTYVYNQERGSGALTALLIDQGGFHDRVYDTALIFQFFRSTLKMRVNGLGSLNQLVDSNGYIMNDSSFHISGFPCAPFETDSNSWLIDSLVAIEAQRYVSNGLVDSNIVCPEIVDTIVSGNESITKRILKAYPNPFHDTFTIESFRNIKEIIIHDVKGSLISAKEVNAKGTIKVTHIQEPGIYLVKIIFNDGSSEFRRVVKLNGLRSSQVH